MCIAAAISAPSGTLYTLGDRDIVAVVEASTAVCIKVVEAVPICLGVLTGVYTSPNGRVL